ncbi:MAG: DNA-processing protein DprA [Gammaproteobacteria bacterium]
MQDNLTAWLTLLHASITTSLDLTPLLEAYDGPANLLDEVSKDATLRVSLPARLVHALLKPDAKRLAPDQAWLEKPANGIITYTDDAYPELLKNISHPPLLLFLQGDASLLQQAQLAVVGSRKPSRYGKDVAGRFAAGLGDYGLVVTSGLASGIDTCAHKGALCNGTVAVLGHGFNYMYPAANRSLAGRIAEEGLLVSEFPITYPPVAANFPRRNRIISGLSKGVLVVEAAIRSGSLITARYALEQGREVFAIPGSVNNDMAQGCHKLIQDGAKLVQEVADIAVELGIESPEPCLPKQRLSDRQKSQHNEDILDDSEKVLLDNIGCDPISVDELFLSTKIDIDILTGKLLKLELAGHIAAVAAGIYIRN